MCQNTKITYYETSFWLLGRLLRFATLCFCFCNVINSYQMVSSLLTLNTILSNNDLLQAYIYSAGVLFSDVIMNQCIQRNKCSKQAGAELGQAQLKL